VPSQCQVGLQPALQDAQSQRVEPGRLGTRERLVGELGQRRSPPQRQGVAEQRRGSDVVLLGERTRPLCGEPLEPAEVQLVGARPQDVAAVAVQQARVRAARRWCRCWW